MKETKKGREGKIGEPMFPRVHVSDTEKGGPRAPPRNKMALYEQLSIPSQRFNSSSFTSQASSSEGLGIGTDLHLFGHKPLRSKKLPSQVTCAEGRSFDNFQSQLKKQRTLLPKDNFTVPSVVLPDSDQPPSKVSNCSNENRILPFSDPNPITRSNRDSLHSSCTDFPLLEKAALSNVKSFVSKGTSDLCEGNMARSEAMTAPLKRNPESRSLLSDSKHSFNMKKQMKDLPVEKSSQDSESCLLHAMFNQSEKKSGSLKNSACARKMDDECHEISETSTMDSVLVFDLTPDHVAKLLSPKLFWKARKVIADQQRVFTKQLFELHKLLQVQRMIAGYPDVLLEGSMNEPCKAPVPLSLEHSVDESSKIRLLEKKLSSDKASKPWLQADQNTDSHEPLEKIEPSTSNEVSKPLYVRKTMASSSHNESSAKSDGGRESSHHHHFPLPVSADPSLHSWPFSPPMGHQWLVPVMSPSEGLVYKPYPVHGFMNSVCGGCGNHGATPMANQAMCQPGLPAPQHQHHGFGMVPYAPYPHLPMYPTMPSMSGSVDQPGSTTQGASNCRQGSQLSVSGVRISRNQQDSNDLPSRKSKLQAAKRIQANDSQLLGSTASSALESRKNASSTLTAEERDDFNVVPVLPAAKEGVQQRETEQLTKVIKVVPRNRRSATESAARIFQFIQEERKRNDLM